MVSIIDYGIGNLLSVQRAFQNIGCDVELVTTGDEVLRAEHLVLPGVGAFGDGMSELDKRNLTVPIKEYCKSGRPFLGICLGMQLMLESSEESENMQGLNIIEGSVTKLDASLEDGIRYKVPNIGWYSVKVNESAPLLLDGIKDTDKFYFVHSYAAHPKHQDNSLADLQYGNNSFSAIVKKGNCYGTQFHPEKSGEAGLKLIYNYIRIK